MIKEHSSFVDFMLARDKASAGTQAAKGVYPDAVMRSAARKRAAMETSDPFVYDRAMLYMRMGTLSPQEIQKVDGGMLSV